MARRELTFAQRFEPNLRHQGVGKQCSQRSVKPSISRLPLLCLVTAYASQYTNCYICTRDWINHSYRGGARVSIVPLTTSPIAVPCHAGIPLLWGPKACLTKQNARPMQAYSDPCNVQTMIVPFHHASSPSPVLRLRLPGLQSNHTETPNRPNCASLMQAICIIQWLLLSRRSSPTLHTFGVAVRLRVVGIASPIDVTHDWRRRELIKGIRN